MITFESLMPEELDELRAGVADQDGMLAFLDSVTSFLKATPVDGGADSDLIFLAGKRLARHGVWDVVPASAVATTLATVPRQSVELFLEAAPASYRNQVLEAPKPQKAVRHGRLRSKLKVKGAHAFGQRKALREAVRVAVKDAAAHNQANLRATVVTPEEAAFEVMIAMGRTGYGPKLGKVVERAKKRAAQLMFPDDERENDRTGIRRVR